MLSTLGTSYPSVQRITDLLPTSDADAVLHRELRTNELAERWQRAVAGAIAGAPRILVDDPPAADPAAESSAPVQLAQELIDLLDSDGEEVRIVSAYLIPSQTLQGAVESAVRRGVRVRILTNPIRSNNHVTAHSAYRNHIGELMSHGTELYEVRVDARDRRRYMIAPTDEKSLALYAKVLVVDRDRVFTGRANLGPRSLRLNTEVGLPVESEALNRRLREDLEPDFLGANAGNLQFDEAGTVVWVSDTLTASEQPAASCMQRVEDWFFAHLPIEKQI